MSGLAFTFLHSEIIGLYIFRMFCPLWNHLQGLMEGLWHSANWEGPSDPHISVTFLDMSPDGIHGGQILFLTEYFWVTLALILFIFMICDF